MPERVVQLFAGQVRAGLSCSIRAYVDDESGDLVIETQDIGASVEAVWGDSDYEYWIRVEAANKDVLVRHLSEEMPVSRDKDIDGQLLSLLKDRYGGSYQASSDFRKWLEERDIPYRFDSYV